MSGKKTRLIDTQDAFNVLSDYYHHNSATQHLALQEALNKVPTADVEPHWIPCSERLPEYGDYRESMECLDGCVWYFTDKGLMGLGYYYYSTKEWSTLRDLKPDGKVIAWMPLPKPYEVKE